jgi:hypothetical protein
MNVFKLIEDNGLTLHGDIEHFAELVRQEEREACARVCDVLSVHPKYASDITKLAAQAIRARSEL